MTTFADFASLFQLGFGTGIGLGFFRAPIALRVRELTRAIDDQIILTSGSASPEIQSRNLDLMTLKIRLVAGNTAVSKKENTPLAAAILGAVINLALLVSCSIFPQEEMTTEYIFWAIVFSVVWFVVVLGWMENIALNELEPLRADVRRLTGSA